MAEGYAHHDAQQKDKEKSKQLSCHLVNPLARGRR
jgi:hypothetical protein